MRPKSKHQMLGWLPRSVRLWIEAKRLQRENVPLIEQARRAVMELGLALPQCTTEYSRVVITGLRTEISDGVDSLWWSATFENVKSNGLDLRGQMAHNLLQALDTARQAIEADRSHAGEWNGILEKGDEMARRAAPVLIGAAFAEFNRNLVGLRRTRLDNCRSLAEVDRTLANARRRLARLKWTVDTAEQLPVRLQRAHISYDELDRAVIIGDPKADEDYTKTMYLIDEASDALKVGNLQRASTILAKAEHLLERLRSHVRNCELEAATEVALWRTVVDLCPHVRADIELDIQRIPTCPTGLQLQEWTDLKRRIAHVIGPRARETRKANAIGLGGGHPFKWGDKSERRLKRFAVSAFSPLREAAQVRPERSVADQARAELAFETPTVTAHQIGILQRIKRISEVTEAPAEG